MKPKLTRSDLKKIAKVGEELYSQIKKKKKLPEGEFIAINCEPGKNFGKFVCGKFDSDTATKFEKKFGDDMMWIQQTDFSLAQKKKNRRWPIGSM